MTQARTFYKGQMPTLKILTSGLLDLRLNFTSGKKTQNLTRFMDFVKENSKSLASFLELGLGALPILFRKEQAKDRRRVLLLSDTLMLSERDQEKSLLLEDIDPDLLLLNKLKNLSDQKLAWQFIQLQLKEEIANFQLLGQAYHLQEVADMIASGLVNEDRVKRELRRNAGKEQICWKPRSFRTDLKPMAVACIPQN